MHSSDGHPQVFEHNFSNNPKLSKYTGGYPKRRGAFHDVLQGWKCNVRGKRGALGEMSLLWGKMKMPGGEIFSSSGAKGFCD